MVFEIDDQMLSMEFHQLMPEEIDDSWKELKNPVLCEYQAPEDVKKQFLQTLKAHRGS